ncbi:MAG TPA: SigE family RNA polymerase sigma factor [Egibacteraceae bacterium]|nr:SigE family RNA polymerase sigma factor [Egibacteraceae bacterium]
MEAVGVIQAVREDDATFAEVFRTHSGVAFRLAMRLCGDRQRAEDVVSEAFAKVYPQWRKGHVEDVGAYLRRAVVNQVNSGFRRLATERRWRARASGDDRGAVGMEDRSADAEVFRKALLRLPPSQRAVLVLRYYEDMTEAQAAEVLGCSLGTVKSQGHRGIAKLRQLLGDAALGKAVR